MKKADEKLYWSRVDEHFHRLLDLPAEKRSHELQVLREREPSLADEVKNMLDAHYNSGTFLETGLMDELSEMAGKIIGPWRIVHELGRGGMSTVYLAERADGSFERKVAVKFLHGFMPGTTMRSRLIAEQQILARLEHPNIARLLDAGITDEGRPFFILEYVDGYPITEYCDRNGLDLHARIKLLEQVCEAVHYAHQRLIIHRDLKPSNIMVTKEGTVKLLDFGIAKIMTQDADDQQLITQTGFSVMTPEYASPEQIRCDNITTSTDGYTLGLLLCELLTGMLPYDVKRKSPLEIGRVITDTVPGKPSTLLRLARNDATANGKTGAGNGKPAPGNHNSHPGIRGHSPQWIRKLKGDLDNIVLKALRKEPERRYGSVQELLQDLRNYQLNLPVSARRETFSYTAGKFIRRHRTGVAAAMVAALLLLSLTLVSIWQAKIAREQRAIAEYRYEDVRALANSVLFEFHDAIVNLPGSTSAREMLVERALDYLDKLADQGSLDHGLYLELAEAYQKVGDVQGNPTNANLGKSEDALESYKKGISLLQSLLGQDENHLRAQIVNANLYGKKADVQAWLGNLEAAEMNMRISADRYAALYRTHPDDPELKMDYVRTLIKNGDLLGNPLFPNLGLAEQSVGQYTLARDILKQLAVTDQHQETVSGQQYGATADHPFGPSAGQHQEAISGKHENPPDGQHGNASIIIHRDSINPQWVRFMGIVYERIGIMMDAADDPEGALDGFSKSMEYRKILVEMDPLNTDAIRDEAVAYEKLGQVHRKSARVLEAKSYFEQAFHIFKWLADADPDNIQAAQSLAISHLHLGNIHYHDHQPNLNDKHSARFHFARSQDLLQNLYDKDPENLRLQSLLSGINRRLQELDVAHPGQ